VLSSSQIKGSFYHLLASQPRDSHAHRVRATFWAMALHCSGVSFLAWTSNKNVAALAISLHVPFPLQSRSRGESRLTWKCGAPSTDGNAGDTRGLERFSQGYGWKDGGEPPRQPRLPRPGGAEQEDVWVRTPA